MNFLIITQPEDFALITALYRSSVDGRRYLYEAILEDDILYNLPDNFTSRTSEVLQVYLKSLGVRMSTVIDDDEFIAGPEDCTEVLAFEINNYTIFCTREELYYLKKLGKVYRRYKKDNPAEIEFWSDAWDYILEHLPFKKKYLTDNITKLFKENIAMFEREE